MIDRSIPLEDARSYIKRKKTHWGHLPSPCGAIHVNMHCGQITPLNSWNAKIIALNRLARNSFGRDAGDLQMTRMRLKYNVLHVFAIRNVVRLAVFGMSVISKPAIPIILPGAPCRQWPKYIRSGLKYAHPSWWNRSTSQKQFQGEPTTCIMLKTQSNVIPFSFSLRWQTWKFQCVNFRGCHSQFNRKKIREAMNATIYIKRVHEYQQRLWEPWWPQ